MNQVLSAESRLTEGVHYKRHEFHKLCGACGVVFDKPIHFRTHSPCFQKPPYVQTKKGLHKYNCPNCSKSFEKKNAWRSHIDFNHCEKTLECMSCGGRMANFNQLNNHPCILKFKKTGQWNHHLHNISVSDASRANQIATHQAVNHVNILQPVPVAEAVRTRSSKERVHLAEGVHYRRIPFRKSCSLCNEIFEKPIHLRTHKNCFQKPPFVIEFNGMETFFCPCCEKKFEKRNSWRFHIEYNHCEKVLECLSCKTQLASFGQLRFHSCITKYRQTGRWNAHSESQANSSATNGSVHQVLNGVVNEMMMIEVDPWGMLPNHSYRCCFAGCEVRFKSWEEVAGHVRTVHSSHLTKM